METTIYEPKIHEPKIIEAKVGMYESHEEAMHALQILSEHKFPLQNVSIIAKAELIEDHMHVKSLKPLKNAPVAIGTIAGVITGILTGMGIFAIPGFGFLFGAGAIVGAIGGFNLGLVGGGILTLLADYGIKKDYLISYEKHIHEGRHLLIVKGSSDEIKKAEHLLHNNGMYLE